jgi:hypothetical protein
VSGRSSVGYPPRQSGFVDLLVDDDGTPWCDPPDDCPVCVLVTHQRTGESRSAWLARIVDRVGALETDHD